MVTPLGFLAEGRALANARLVHVALLGLRLFRSDSATKKTGKRQPVTQETGNLETKVSKRFLSLRRRRAALQNSSR
jgi:hypothetical protein